LVFEKELSVLLAAEKKEHFKCKGHNDMHGVTYRERGSNRSIKRVTTGRGKRTTISR